MKMKEDWRFTSYLQEYSKLIKQYLDVLSEKRDTKVSSYNKDENIRKLAIIMNCSVMLDEIDAMKNLEKTDELDERLTEITFEFGKLKAGRGFTDEDLAETKKIFKEIAENPEKREQPITEDIIKEAYGHYYKKIKREPESMSLENFDKYLLSLSELVNSDEYKHFLELADNEEYQKYEENYYKENGNYSLVKDLKKVTMHSLLLDAAKIRKAVRENPKAIFDKEKMGEHNDILYSNILPGVKDLTLQKLKNRDFPIPDGFKKREMYYVCDKIQEWLENLDKNVEATRTYVKEKIEINTVGAFENHLNRLENSLTTRNSDEYKNIIKMVRLVNTKDKLDQFEKFGDLTDKQNYALKLLAIKNSINKYIGHKAEHGVNKNVGGKLAAVEALNAEVSKRLSSLNLPPFTVGDKTYDIKKYAITEKQEYKVAEKVNQAAASPYNPDNRADENANLNDACMKRIILKAIEKNYSSQIPKLERARHLFERNEEPQAPQAGGPKL